MADERALVLGGGGVAGIAWQTGVLAGLAAAGVEVTDADLVVGTSAGSTVAAQVTSGLPWEELLARQTDPGKRSEELVPAGSVAEALERMLTLQSEGLEPAEIRRRVGALALAAETVPESARRKVIEGRLPAREWPRRPRLVIPAVEATSGAPVLFDAASGVDLVDAVAASCAVPGIWPPVTIADARYVDGGLRSMNNADLAAGHGRVLVVAPFADPVLEEDVAGLTGDGARVEVVAPDEASAAAFGTDPLDPATRTPAAEAGYAQGRAEAERVAALWK
ncbi:patatin-like phospholipase family protein [Actinomadura kijaniata]|uniref:patatin-like phospholipase family protein n=1 Tax=Actinomadura kijaniata TaxID=46161 RepID=UPI0008361708|nr:patatin-like phospholipase family protein [Actinomadura kijaniata]